MARVNVSNLSVLFRWMTLLLLLECLKTCKANIHKLSIRNDSRDLIEIERFGFTANGHLDLALSGVAYSFAADVAEDPSRMGFLLLNEDETFKFLQELDEKTISDCGLQSSNFKPFFTFVDLEEHKEYTKNFTAPSADRYTLIFVNCVSPTKVSMNLMTYTYNLEGKTGARNYLSDGETLLPALFSCFFLIYIVLEGLWIYVCVRQRETAHRIHICMGVLVFLKALYMFSEAEEKAYIKRTGTPHGWDIAFYAFGFLKGVMLFTVIALIGTGWSILKPYLQGREKRVLMIVIPLQLMENIAFVIMNETGLSGKDWYTWYQVLLLLDVICCCAVLFPIVWSIKHLREAAHTDGKAARNLVKLTLFRQYYVVVISFIYATRVLVFALNNVPYRYSWIKDLANELATLAFYIFTGYKFRPVPHNPYFVLDEEEEDAAAEAALKDDDFEL